MRRFFAAAAALFVSLCLYVPVLAENDESAAMSAWERIAPMVRALGFFLLMMAIIYGLLLLTRFIGKKWGKH